MLPDQFTQERIARNDARFREANEQIEAAAERHEVDIALIPFMCECADMSCHEIIRIALSDYEEVRSNPRCFINAPGHQVAAKGAAVVVAERDGWNIVEKIDHAGDVAERLDQREPSEAQESAS